MQVKSEKFYLSKWLLLLMTLVIFYFLVQCQDPAPQSSVKPNTPNAARKTLCLNEKEGSVTAIAGKENCNSTQNIIADNLSTSNTKVNTQGNQTFQDTSPDRDEANLSETLQATEEAKEQATSKEAAIQGDPAVIRWVEKDWLPAIGQGEKQLTKNNYSYETFLVNAMQKDTELFSCPKNSLLSGRKGIYTPEHKDRKWFHRCQFLEDGRGFPLVKKNCSEHQPQTEDGRNITAGDDIDDDAPFMCPEGKFMAGEKSRYMQSPKDRIRTFQCCEMYNREGQKIVWKKEVAQGSPEGTAPDLVCEQKINYSLAANIYQSYLFANAPHNSGHSEIINFTCQQHTILHSVWETYTMTGRNATFDQQTYPDRILSFKCCALGLSP